jgi:uncharacterized protein YdiU (UPF0061 family)
MPWNFDNSYLKMGSEYYTECAVTNIEDPKILLFNEGLAADLDLLDLLKDEKTTAKQLCGALPIAGSSPIAQAYAGHQFGYFNMLGDGRACLLGEHLDPQGGRWDIQLKGSGSTAYSRRGDGKATVRSMLREFIISEAMHHLGIPSSRSLAVVFTGLPVYREEVHPGAVLTRIASSHLRIGSFEYARQFLTQHALQQLLDYSIERHFPAIASEQTDKVSLFLRAVMERQIRLVCEWMRVGFIHGVMNTDNIAISGETIDYGPCAFMNQYSPDTVFSSIDTEGRYRFGNQGNINHWNLSILAGALLPLIDPNQELALEKAKAMLAAYKPLFEASYYNTMAAKLGVSDGSDQKVRLLIDELLQWMHANEADYTNTFLYLQETAGFDASIYVKDSFLIWQKSYKACLSEKNIAEESRLALMKVSNPVYIPRNHLVEDALDEVYSSGKLQKLHQLWRLMLHPYRMQQQAESYMQVPPKDENYQTFCGT